MVTEALHILGIGARTPLGLRSESSAAAYRARISRLGQHPYLIDRFGEPMVAAVDGVLEPRLGLSARLIALAEGALSEIWAAFPQLSPKPRVRLFLALPEYRPGFTQYDAARVKRELLEAPDRPVELSAVEVFPYGHAAGGLALQAAAATQSRSQELCLVGGVDSYFDPDTMEWLDENRQLAGEDARSAFVPGEGACMLLLCTHNHPLGFSAHGAITALGLASEGALIKTEDACFGLGLTAAVDAACSSLSGHSINDIFCDINGERYRAEEWGFVCLRLAHYFDNPVDYRSPAGNWGDMGAASMPLFAMLACQAAARGYARGTTSLAWASSEGGQRAAMVVETKFGGANQWAR